MSETDSVQAIWKLASTCICHFYQRKCCIHKHPQSHQYAKINTQYMAHDGIAFCMKRKHHNAWFMLSVHIKEQGTLYTNRYMCSSSLAQRSYCTVFSPAYLRHVCSTSLHYRIPFDVGNGDNPKALKWLQAPPIHALLSCLEFYLGRTLEYSIRGLLIILCKYSNAGGSQH